MKLRNLLLAAALGVSASAQAINIGNIEFADNAFVDGVISYTGDFFAIGAEDATLNDVLSDIDPASYAASFDAGASLTLGFNDNHVANGEGDDLAVFDIGTNNTIAVTLNGVTRNYLTVYTGTNAEFYNLNVARIDLSDFGIASGATISRVTLGVDIEADDLSRPAVSLVGGINVAPVPEPETYAMMGMGLAALAAARVRKKRA